MLSLDPLKLLIVLVVALILLGPDKLPGFARQLGAGWAAFRRFRDHVENEVRDTIPDLPSVQQIAHAVRSPVAFLDSLADLHEGDAGTQDASAGSGVGAVRAAGDGEADAAGPVAEEGAGEPEARSGESVGQQDRPSGADGRDGTARGVPGLEEARTLEATRRISAEPGLDIPGVGIASPSGLRVPEDPSMN